MLAYPEAMRQSHRHIFHKLFTSIIAQGSWTIWFETCGKTAGPTGVVMTKDAPANSIVPVSAATNTKLLDGQ